MQEDSSIKIPTDILAKVLGCNIFLAEKHSPFIRGAMKAFDITTKERIAMFLAQTGHETGSLSRFEENLNYSKQGLLNTWPKRFTPELAEQCQRNPEKIACIVYADRMGNASPESGDGWKYRGRGAIQLTGLNNYRLASWYFKVDFVGNPDSVLEPVNSWLVAGWFWDTNKLNHYADRKDIVSCTRIINGGQNGIEDRKERYNKAMTLLEGIV